MSWGPTVWVLLGEMFNNRIRGAAISVSASAQWIANFAIHDDVPDSPHGRPFLGADFTYFAVLSIVFVVVFVKETKGKRLEEMDDSAGTKRPGDRSQWRFWVCVTGSFRSI